MNTKRLVWVALLILVGCSFTASAAQTTSVNMSSTLNKGFDSINGYNCTPLNGSTINADANTTIGAYWTPPTEALDGNCNFTGTTLDDFFNAGSGAIAVMVKRTCAWTPVSNLRTIYTDAGAYFTLFVTAANTARLQVYEPGGYSYQNTPAFRLNEWEVLLFSWDGTNLYTYWNGEYYLLNTTWAGTLDPITVTYPWSLGANSNGGSIQQSTCADITKVRTWDNNVTAAQALAIYEELMADTSGATPYLTNAITEPTNTTYSATPTANASFNSNNASTANCTRYLDRAWFASTIVNNATPYYDTIADGTGTHNYTIYCENATLGISDWDAVYYTVGYALNLTIGCSPVALSFNFYNEETLLDANASMDATFNLTSGPGATSTFYGNWTNQPTIDVCLLTGATATLDSFQIYYSEGYDQRAYFLTHAVITNASHANVSLYMSNTTLNKVTYFALTDDNNLPLEDYYITALRYYPALNQYYGVAMVLTDNNGEANTYITPNDVWYKFLVTQMDGTVIELFTPARTVFCDPSAYSCNVELNVGGRIVGEYWQYHGQVAHSCVYNNVTRYLTCTVSDASGVLNSFTLTTYKVGAYANTTDCYQALNASTGTLSCYITNTTQEVTWLLTGWGSEYYLGSGSFYTTSTPYGDIGLFAAFAVFAALTFLGAAVSPGLSIALGLLSLGVTRWLQLYDVSYGALGAIVIVGLIFVWRLRQ